MSTAGSATQVPHPPKGAPTTVPAFARQLLPLYDELAELEALNSFLYDAFLTLAADAEGAFNVSSSTGLGLTCQWLRQRQVRLKQEFHQLIQYSKGAD